MTLSPLFSPRRELGRTGFRATALGLGDLADRSIPLEQCVATLRRGLEHGLNLIDTAPGYEDGYSEEIVGHAVRAHGHRESLFLIDKIDHPDRPVASQVEESLRALAIDYVDCFVFHGISDLETWTHIVKPGGAMEQLGGGVRTGRLRFRGVSSHHPDVLEAAIRSGTCDVVMFAVGPYCDRRYMDRILPLAREMRVGTVCFKAFGAGKLLADTSGYSRPLGHDELPPNSVTERTSGSTADPADLSHRLPHLTVAECLHYTLTQDPDVTLLGLSSPAEQDQAFAAAALFREPLEPSALAAIESRAAEAVRHKGPCWWDPQETGHGIAVQ